MMNKEYNWYALKTRYQAEFKCIDQLIKLGIESFTPWEYSYRRWSDRTKRIQAPKFPQYIFSKINCVELPILNCCRPHVHIVKRGNNPDPIPGRIINSLKAISHDENNYHFQDCPIKPGEMVEVISGTFHGTKS